MMTVTWGAATDRGLVRASNEDSLLAAPPVFLVADGMGGYRAGDEASAIVVEEFSTAAGFDRVTAGWVVEVFQRAGSRIRAGSAGGTTVAGAAVVQQESNPYWLIFNIGDSRIYRCADGAMAQISVDHSVVQELVDDGRIAPKAARLHPQRNVITRAVGTQEEPEPDFWLVPVEQGERLLLCSDGLSSELEPEAIAAILSDRTPAQAAADALVAAALAAGGRDNVTAVVVDVVEVGADFAGELVLDITGMPGDRALDSDDESTRPRRLPSLVTPVAQVPR